MKKTISLSAIFSLVLFSQTLFAQKDAFIKEYLERFENSRTYLFSVVKAMPADKYSYKPTDDEMTFARQFLHIAGAMNYHCQELLVGKKDSRRTDSTYTVGGKSIEMMMELVNKTFDETSSVLKQFDPSHFEDRINYGPLSRTKRQVFLLLADHITHHRAQMLVYLRLNGIVPPKYVEFQ